MNQLVADDVIGLGERSGQGEHDAALQGLRDTTGALVQIPAHDVGLLEVGMARVQNQRLGAAQLMAEQGGVARIPALPHSCRLERRFTLLGIEEDPEMLGVENLELQGLVLHFVAPEPLCLACHRDRQSQSGGHQHQPTCVHSVHLVVRRLEGWRIPPRDTTESHFGSKVPSKTGEWGVGSGA